mmetsp:Transcript_42221/g.99110  ORF Transcript_42221/g.99110 Transcript_42221/m.99110 type:complete len:971 (-) Transcript_42221:102-3014(-)
MSHAADLAWLAATDGWAAHRGEQVLVAPPGHHPALRAHQEVDDLATTNRMKSEAAEGTASSTFIQGCARSLPAVAAFTAAAALARGQRVSLRGNRAARCIQMLAKRKKGKKSDARLDATAKALEALKALEEQNNAPKAKKERGRTAAAAAQANGAVGSVDVIESPPDSEQEDVVATNGSGAPLEEAVANGSTNGITNGNTNGSRASAKAEKEQVPAEAPRRRAASGFGSGKAQGSELNMFAGLDGFQEEAIFEKAQENGYSKPELSGKTATSEDFLRASQIPMKKQVPKSEDDGLDAYRQNNADEEEEEEDSDDEELLKLKAKEEEEDEGYVVRPRRRGDEELVSFEMETGGLKGVSLGLENVSVRFGNTMVLSDATWKVTQGERMALVGPNGCGKTTQLKVLLGDVMSEEGGKVRFNRDDLNMALLSQGFVDELDPECTVEEELLKALPEKAAIKQESDAVQLELEGLEEGTPERDEAIQRLTDLQTKSEEYGVFELDDRLERVCQQVGFLPEDLQTEVKTLSGGWKVRLGLAKIFMQAPDVLLLDEPTNHLDLQSVEWLESFLSKQDLPIVVVSHDREFMDRTCTKIVDTVEGATYSYDCNYTEFLRKREARFERWRKKFDEQSKKEREIIKYIKENKSKSNMANARKRREDELNRMRESDDWVDQPPRFLRRIKFRFPGAPERRGRKVPVLAEMRGVSHGYGEGADAQILKDANFEVRMGDKIGIVGNNGVGKSTLLKLLLGLEEPSGGGDIKLPDEDMTRYFTQHQADLLPAEKTVMEVVREANQMTISETELFEILKQFRFRGERLERKVEYLSGGEKARLAIVRMMLQPASLLVFDEPTNHLDVPMKETLEYSLQEYNGGYIIVSHDRWFLSQTCTRIVEIKDGQVLKYEGDYRHYIDSNPEVRRKVEKHYVKGFGEIESLEDRWKSERRKAKQRSVVRKNRRKAESKAENAARKEFLQTLGKR